MTPVRQADMQAAPWVLGIMRLQDALKDGEKWLGLLHQIFRKRNLALSDPV
jgi:hypothetical protein